MKAAKRIGGGRGQRVASDVESEERMRDPDNEVIMKIREMKRTLENSLQERGRLTREEHRMLEIIQEQEQLLEKYQGRQD